jgi:hypothetical protein
MELPPACASTPEGERPVPAVPPALVSRIEVDTQGIPDAAEERFNSYGGEIVLREQFQRRLDASQLMSQDAPYELRLRLTALRFRSGAASFWLGMMAGSDSIAVSGDLTRCGRVVREFPASASSVQGGLLRPSSTSRLAHLAAALATRWTEQALRERKALAATTGPCASGEEAHEITREAIPGPVKELDQPAAAERTPPEDSVRDRSIEDRLRALDRLYRDGVLSEEEYRTKKGALLREL